MTERAGAELVTTAGALFIGGVSRGQLRTELGARRWRRAGYAIVLHNGPLSAAQARQVARLHAGPRAMFTAFTAAELVGLSGWDRPAIDVLAPAGTRLRAGCPVPVRLHLHGARPIQRESGRAIEVREHALLRAAGTTSGPRAACGLLAAAVQQRVTTAEALTLALDAFPRLRHHAAAQAALADIAGGSQALSEIDFMRLCRRHLLPEPLRQELRRDQSGRRRYLDATWRRPDGRLVVVEVDGALHLAARQWWADQLRQNEIAITNALVLRFPSVVIRAEEQLVAGQLRRALLV